MGKQLKLTSEIPVSVNHYMKPRPFLAHGKPAVTMYETTAAKNYKKAFAEYAKSEVVKQGWEKPSDKYKHVYCDCVFYFDRTDMDANNYYKLLLDAVTDSGVIWQDDNVVCERTQGIYYDIDSPRIEMTIYPVDYVGIFPDQEHLDNFETRCVSCSRYRGGACSVLRKAKEGRIQNDVADLVCNDYKEKKNGKEKGK